MHLTHCLVGCTMWCVDLLVVRSYSYHTISNAKSEYQWIWLLHTIETNTITITSSSHNSPNSILWIDKFFSYPSRSHLTCLYVFNLDALVHTSEVLLSLVLKKSQQYHFVSHLFRSVPITKSRIYLLTHTCIPFLASLFHIGTILYQIEMDRLRVCSTFWRLSKQK